MRILLACCSFLLVGICVATCLVVALDGHISYGGYLPVFRAGSGVTPIGAMVVLVAILFGAIFLIAGISIIDRH
jgi:hypothetical protein